MADPSAGGTCFKDDRYIGSRLQDFMGPATWACEMVAGPGQQGKTVPQNARKPSWMSGVHVVHPEVYLHRKMAMAPVEEG